RRLQAEVQQYARQMEAQLRTQADELSTTTQVMNTIMAISALIASRSDPPDLIRAITLQIRPLLGQKAVALLTPGSDGSLSGFMVHSGRLPTKIEVSAIDDPDVASTLVSARSSDLGIKLRMKHDGMLARKMGSDSIALAGLHWLDTPLGVLAFAPSDETILAD